MRGLLNVLGRAGIIGAVFSACAGAGFGQTSPADAPAATLAPSPVLTLDQDRLFRSSAYGKRIAAEIEKALRDLAIENREIEARLAAEEQDLTTRRPTLPATDFRALADDFDARVVAIRRTQDEKQVALNTRRDTERQNFYQAAAPILGALVREAGAVAILDTRAVFLSADRIDVTDEAIARIDARMGDGVAPAPGGN